MPKRSECHALMGSGMSESNPCSRGNSNISPKSDPRDNRVMSLKWGSLADMYNCFLSQLESAGQRLCLTRMCHQNTAHLVRPCGAMRGGCNRYSYFWGFRRSLCTLLGRRFRGRTIGTVKMAQTIFHRFIRRKFSAARHTQFLVRRVTGGHPGYCSHRPF